MMNQLTLEQAVVLSGFTGVLMCRFDHVHRDVEKRLNRPVWTHEFADQEFVDQLKKVYRDDFMVLIKDVKQ
jgi:hypothetical protein